MEREELTSWDVEQLNRLANGNRNAGKLVETKNGVLGRIYNHEESINGKVRVHCVDGKKLLCNPQTLTLKGFID